MSIRIDRLYDLQMWHRHVSGSARSSPTPSTIGAESLDTCSINPMFFSRAADCQAALASFSLSIDELERRQNDFYKITTATEDVQVSKSIDQATKETHQLLGVARESLALVTQATNC